MRYLLLLILLIINPAFAYVGFNVCNHGQETLDTVVCDGPGVLKQTTIKGNVQVSGTLQASEIKANDLKVLGATELSDSSISGEVNITGSLTADQVQFGKGVAVTSDKIILKHTIINGTLIVTSPDTTPYIQVQCGSVIKGSVLFFGKPGVVQVTGDSVVQGKIVNGATEFIKQDCNE